MLAALRQRAVGGASEASVRGQFPIIRRRACALLHDTSVLRVQSVNISGSSGGHHQHRQLHHGHLACLPQAAARLLTPTHPRETTSCCSSSSSSCGIRQLSSSRSRNSRGGGGGSKNKRAAPGAAPPAAAAAAAAAPRVANTETTETVITLDGVSKQLPGGRQLFADASLSFVRGAKVGVLGVNGSGKSTVLKIIAGVGELVAYQHRHPTNRASCKLVVEHARWPFG